MPAGYYKRPALEERFFKYVNKTDTCWLWTGSTDSRGYGKLVVGNKLKVATHVSLLLEGIDVPTCMCVMHKCDTPLCVNPDHLQIGTQKENIRDAVAKKRMNYGDDHWTRRHPEWHSSRKGK